ncbi:hypothetical protein IAQ61_001988 [Plenodomus lingam]|uniref:uncharacterized protein n=1 Tax=Leptosphaeria maculans TaxID=5022 RepID=UPI003328CD13|nr:hypothetical protein IAQ61_001988 [Plenodomus lingam]
MSPPRNEVTGDALRRFALLTAHLRQPGSPVVKSLNPLDEFINEQQNRPKEKTSKVGQVAAIFEAKMNKKERWDGWYWTPPIYTEFGVVAKKNRENEGV